MVHVLCIELARMLVLLTLRLGFFLCQSQSERQLSILHLYHSLLFPGELKRRLFSLVRLGEIFLQMLVEDTHHHVLASSDQSEKNM